MTDSLKDPTAGSQAVAQNDFETSSNTNDLSTGKSKAKKKVALTLQGSKDEDDSNCECCQGAKPEFNDLGTFGIKESKIEKTLAPPLLGKEDDEDSICECPSKAEPKFYDLLTSGMTVSSANNTVAPHLLEHEDDEDSNCECRPQERKEPHGIPANTSSVKPKCACVQKNNERTPEVEDKGKRQSPIDIKLNDVVTKNYPSLYFSPMHYDVPERMFAERKDSYEVFLKYDICDSPRISRGPLKSPYRLWKLQFHWGAEDDKGSEHTVDGKVFIMELHALYIQEELPKDNANPKDNGYVIVGYFFQLEENDHMAVNALLSVFERLDKIQVPKNRNPQINIQRPFAITDLIETFSKSYITYEGSLTEEPFSENVTWILAPYCIKISPAQMARFRALKAVKQNNFREQQELQDRVVNIVEGQNNIFHEMMEMK